MSDADVDLLSPLNGYSVHVSELMVGFKTATLAGGKLYVSPAMWDLISHAETQEELRYVLSHIPVLKVSSVTWYPVWPEFLS